MVNDSFQIKFTVTECDDGYYTPALRTFTVVTIQPLEWTKLGRKMGNEYHFEQLDIPMIMNQIPKSMAFIKGLLMNPS